jgi:hypothetical protein
LEFLRVFTRFSALFALLFQFSAVVFAFFCRLCFLVVCGVFTTPNTDRKMSSDADIMGKLSRIFETHTFSRGENDFELDDLLDDLEYEGGGGGYHGGGDYNYSPSRSMGFGSSSPPRGLANTGGGLNGFASSGALRSPGRMM